MEEVKSLAKNRVTGSPEELADHLNISKSTLKRIIRLLRDQNVPIKYCRIEKTYFVQ